MKGKSVINKTQITFPGVVWMSSVSEWLVVLVVLTAGKSVVDGFVPGGLIEREQALR